MNELEHALGECERGPHRGLTASGAGRIQEPRAAEWGGLPAADLAPA
jgi:hypothetical protein